MLESVQYIFIRQVTRGDFFHVEKHPSKASAGGGSQTYFDIPLSDNGLSKEELWRFLGVAPPASPTDDPWPDVTIQVASVGDATTSIPVTFGQRKGNKRYKISNQARQYGGSARHPAWTVDNGFPKAPDDVQDKDDPRMPDVSSTKIYVVKTFDGNYYAGFVNANTMPATWPKNLGLEALFLSTSSKMLQFSQGQHLDVPPLVARILDAWKRKKNVLLYGPPGTGKTYAMQKLWQLLDEGNGGQSLSIDPSDKANPFQSNAQPLPFPTPVRREWVTFHQNFSYENFVLALRPDSSSGALELVPRAGVLLDAAMSVDGNLAQIEPCGSAVIYIDEVNRGNVSRIFGEFITFMDEEYRAHQGDGALPVPLSALRHAGNNQTEPVERARHDKLALPIPWHFPEHVYLLASMNSVDRAVAPLDTALARRFERIEVGPDLHFLADYLGLTASDKARLLKSPPVSAAEDEDELEVEEEGDADEETTDSDGAAASTPPANAAETAWLLLYRLNYELAATLGADFEIGHTYMMKVKDGADEDERFRILADIWDGSLYPQLRERFANRPEDLLRLMRIDPTAKQRKDFLFKPRPRPSTETSARARPVVDVVSLRDAALDGQLEQVKSSLRVLAGAMN